MGIFGRLFGSGNSKADRVEQVARKADELSAKAAADRADLMVKLKHVLEKAKTVVAGENNPEWLAFKRELRDVTPKSASFVQLHRQDHALALVSCLVTSVRFAADAFDRRSVAHIMPRDVNAEGKLTITTLSLMAEHPECLDEVKPLAPARDRMYLQLSSSEVAHVMSVYEALWKAFVYDKDLVCPLDVGGKGSVRTYLTSRGRW